MPCPEYRYLGLKREPITKEEYNWKNHRTINKNIAKDTLNIIKEYLKIDYEILGIIGINESPTCGIIGEMEIFMKELHDSLNK